MKERVQPAWRAARLRWLAVPALSVDFRCRPYRRWSDQRVLSPSSPGHWWLLFGSRSTSTPVCRHTQAQYPVINSKGFVGLPPITWFTLNFLSTNSISRVCVLCSYVKRFFYALICLQSYIRFLTIVYRPISIVWLRFVNLLLNSWLIDYWLDKTAFRNAGG